MPSKPSWVDKLRAISTSRLPASEDLRKLNTDLAYDSIVSVMSGDLIAGLMTLVTCVLSRLVGNQLPCHTP